VVEGGSASDVRWIFPYGKFSAIFFQKIFRFLKSSLNISFFNLLLVALGLGGFESCMCSYLTVAVCCVSRCNNLQLCCVMSMTVMKISRKNLNRKIFWKIFHLTSLGSAHSFIPALIHEEARCGPSSILRYYTVIKKVL
jgi:hypothetical protein